MREPRPAGQLPCADGDTVRQLVECPQNSHVASAGKYVIERMGKAHGSPELEGIIGKSSYHMVNSLSTPRILTPSQGVLRRLLEPEEGRMGARRTLIRFAPG